MKQTWITLRMLGIVVLVVVIGMLIVAATPIVGSPATPAPSLDQFCQQTGALPNTMPRTIDDAGQSTAARLAAKLFLASPYAPAQVKRDVKQLVASLRAAAQTDENKRSSVNSHQAPRYRKALTKFAAWVAKYCPAQYLAVGNLGDTGGASQTACLTDAATIRSAEDNYSLLNGSFASLDDLVSFGLLQRVSSYYAAVRVDSPPGGFTLVAVPSGPCADLPVTG